MVVVLLSRDELPDPFGTEESINPERSAVRGPRGLRVMRGGIGVQLARHSWAGKGPAVPLIAVVYSATADTAFPISGPTGGLADERK
jgi:hypothetical protein